MEARKRGLVFEVTGVDKFPRMTDYVTLADVQKVPDAVAGGWEPTWRQAQPSCMKAFAISMQARSVIAWSKAG